jgi:ketosteroid isomerase-like protein
MSQENVEIVTGLVEAWNAADIEAILAVFHAECEVVFPPEVPEPGPFRGHAELRGSVEGFLAAWASHRAEVVELTLEDGAVLAMLHLTGRGSESGVEMDETDAHVFAFRDGKIISWRNFADRSQALEAVRLSE